MGEELLVNTIRSQTVGVRGRCLASARDQHLVIDEPAYMGGPGEAMSPAEAFLSGVCGCGVLLVESFAHKDGLPVMHVSATIEGIRAKDKPMDFKEVRMAFEVRGVGQKEAEALVERFKAR
jgi:uncharacterized OsmC-like protein